MAFNMKRPIIKGTPLHKASIAKAKESIVSQRRTQADGGLVQAAGYLGESYVPHGVDFSIDSPDMSITKQDLKEVLGKKKEKKEKDVLVGDTESADSKYVAPYVEKAEDEDVLEDAGQDDELDMSNFVISEAEENRGYKNWKVREEKENIRLAEENKARLDAASSERYNEYATSKGFDMSTEEGRKQAGEEIEYNEARKRWEHPQGKSEDVLADKDAEALMKKEKQRLDSEREENRLDKQMAEKNIKASAKEDEKLKKRAEIEKRNKAIRERNKVIADAKEHFGTETLTKTQLEEYKEIKADELEGSEPIEIPEQDDPEPGDFTYDGNDDGIPDYINRWRKSRSIGPEVKSPMQMRDDRIYRNARKDGPVRRNMIKSGYEPE